MQCNKEMIINERNKLKDVWLNDNGHENKVFECKLQESKLTRNNANRIRLTSQWLVTKFSDEELSCKG